MGRTSARQAVPTQSPAPSPINRGAYYQSAVTPGMVSQPQNIAAGTATGQGYTREQLRRLIEKDRRKKKKLMLLGIPGLLVVGSIVTLLLLLFVFSGLTPAEYKKQALVVHADVIKAIEGNEVPWETDYTADSYSSLCATIDANMEASLTTIETAKSTVSELKPPKEVMQLNRDLLIFYDNVESYVQREQAVFAFGKEWSAIWQEWVDTPYATKKLKDVSTAAEAVALFDQDIATIDSFTARLRALNPPPECKNMSDETIAKLQEERVLLDRLKRAQINYDVAAYNAAANDYDYFYQNTSSVMDALLDDLIDFYMEGARPDGAGQESAVAVGRHSGFRDSATSSRVPGNAALRLSFTVQHVIS